MINTALINMFLQKKLLNSIVVFVIFSIQFFIPQQVVAQTNLEVCTSISSTTSPTYFTEGVGADFVVNFVLTLQPGLTTNDILVKYDGGWFTTQGEAQLVSLGGNNYQASIPVSRLAEYGGTANLNIWLTTNVGTMLKTTHGSDCLEQFPIVRKVTTSNPEIIAGGCENNLANHFTCTYDLSWSVSRSNCGSGFVANTSLCEGVENLHEAICLPCRPTAGVIGHNQTCTNTNECVTGLVCRNSNSGGLKCLYPPNSQGSAQACVSGETECLSAYECDAPVGTITTCGSIAECSVNQDCITRYSDPGATCQLVGGSPRCILSTATNPDDPSLDTVDFYICDQIPSTNSQLINDCQRCVGTREEAINRPVGENKMWTAVGCFDVGDDNLWVKSLITLTIGLSGGIALLLILFGSFTVSTSASNPEQLKLGQEVVAAAVTGLLFIILSVAIMQFIGVGLFKIPGL